MDSGEGKKLSWPITSSYLDICVATDGNKGELQSR
jgi:hypothetical protein